MCFYVGKSSCEEETAQNNSTKSTNSKSKNNSAASCFGLHPGHGYTAEAKTSLQDVAEGVNAPVWHRWYLPRISQGESWSRRSMDFSETGKKNDGFFSDL